MPWLADTGVLLRMSQPPSSERQVVQEAVENLIAAGETLYVSTQNMIEFRNVATRPAEARGGLGMSTTQADAEIVTLESIFQVAHDSAAVYEEWKRLVSAHSVQGRNVHDARIAAIMRVHGITHILTLNPSDFARYTGVTALTPEELLASS